MLYQGYSLVVACVQIPYLLCVNVLANVNIMVREYLISTFVNIKE